MIHHNVHAKHVLVEASRRGEILRLDIGNDALDEHGYSLPGEKKPVDTMHIGEPLASRDGLYR